MSGINRIGCFALAAALLTPVTVCAEVYRWVDEEGVTNYGQRPPANVEAKKVKTWTGRSTPSPRTGSSTLQMRSFVESRQQQQKQGRQEQQPVPPSPAEKATSSAGSQDKKQHSRELRTLSDQLNEFNQAKGEDRTGNDDGLPKPKTVSQKLKAKNKGSDGDGP